MSILKIQILVFTYIFQKIHVVFLWTVLEVHYTKRELQEKKKCFGSINEVLAAGLILKSKWNKKDNFHDPMCGSGTLLIEAALIAYNIPQIFLEKILVLKNGLILMKSYGKK